MSFNYLLIPGNPPAVYFYEQWGKEIAQTQAGARVSVSSYLHVTEKNSKKFMQQLTEGHLANLREFHQRTGQRVTVIGHSLGAYFGLRLLDQAEEIIDKVILLHPFLRQPERRGQRILNAAGFFYGKEKLQRKIVQSKRYLDLLHDELPYVTEQEVLQAFQIVKHEKEVIGGDDSPLVIADALRKKIHLFYSAKDIWCSTSVVRALKAQIPYRECMEPHGFVTEDKYRHSLFAKILDVMVSGCSGSLVSSNLRLPKPNELDSAK